MTVLITGDVNIHVCCPEKPLVKIFLDFLASFELIQSVNGPTQKCGHTLDLVLTYGLSVLNLEISNAVFLDHMPILFYLAPPGQSAKRCVPVRRSCSFKPSTAVRFLIYL